MHVSQTPVSEVHFAAQTIAQLVRENGLRYRDIAIITGDLSSYNNYVRKIFPQYHIPAFIDETRRILLNPCLEFVRGALEMCERDFACIPVFRFLRTQMAGITREQIDRLENYVLATGIRGRRRWDQDWDYRVGGISEEEVSDFVGAGAQSVVLGSNILRASTAGPVALSLLSRALGRFA